MSLSILFSLFLFGYFPGINRGAGRRSRIYTKGLCLPGCLPTTFYEARILLVPPNSFTLFTRQKKNLKALSGQHA